ncbi:DUF695 domain-containing protein [Alishewanella sp. HL-SH05]|uniref:DUF695 domain-containing protein n=1 Tax=Alishewanella sp. HL-SH05 TaxID=3461145 RepID=UPI004043514E
MANWDFYQANINDKIASIYINLDAEEELSPRHVRLFWFFIKLKIERDDGLSHDDEVESLFEFEDQLTAFVCNENLQFVGRITTAGMRQFYFYGTEDANYEELCEVFLRNNNSYLYQYNGKDDPERSQYKNVLYPGPLGFEQIKERRNNA